MGKLGQWDLTHPSNLFPPLLLLIEGTEEVSIAHAIRLRLEVVIQVGVRVGYTYAQTIRQSLGVLELSWFGLALVQAIGVGSDRASDRLPYQADLWKELVFGWDVVGEVPQCLRGVLHLLPPVAPPSEGRHDAEQNAL